jgi:hypothetical protein
MYTQRSTTDSSTISGAQQNKLVIQEDLLGNHAHLKHYRHIHPETMMVNLDITLQLVSEAMLNRSSSVGDRIRQIFIEGDTNHDGVLSFSEFMDIVKKVAPEYHERKILKMFREALMTGSAPKNILLLRRMQSVLYCILLVYRRRQ